MPDQQYAHALVFTPNGTDAGTIDITWMWTWQDGDTIPISNPPAWVNTFLADRASLVTNYYVVAKLANGWLVDCIALVGDEANSIAAIVAANPGLGMKWWTDSAAGNCWETLKADAANQVIAEEAFLAPQQQTQTIDGQQVQVNAPVNTITPTPDPATWIAPHSWAGW